MPFGSDARRANPTRIRVNRVFGTHRTSALHTETPPVVGKERESASSILIASKPLKAGEAKKVRLQMGTKAEGVRMGEVSIWHWVVVNAAVVGIWATAQWSGQLD